VGKLSAGNLIQIPAMGFGVAIPIVNSAITTNGSAVLSDHDLCGIFSGKITDFNQITDAGNLTPGPITVGYDSGASGVSLALTNHLAEVCTSADSAITFSATTEFASLFGTVPSNFSGNLGTWGVANYLASLSGTAVTSAVGYVTPIYTSLIANNAVILSNGQRSPLLVASVVRGKTAELPTEANIAAALGAPTLGVNLDPPGDATAGMNPALWAPSIAVTKSGYPIAGYAYIVLAQCYAQANVKDALVAFLKDHFNKAEYRNIQIANGFAPLPNGAATGQWRTAVVDDLLENTNGWNINIGNATACSGLAGR
jgi:ABC-type phosphate transport system substrate-binding protein